MAGYFPPPNITIERLRERYRYNPETGEVYSIRSHRALRSDLATTLDYRRICVSIIAWALYHGRWPSFLIDHKNRDRTDNSIKNLREATHNQNGANKQVPNASCGLRGVSPNTRSRINPWMALIRISGKQTYLGSFPTAEEAHEAYKAAATQHHGEFAEFGTRP